MKQKCLFFLAYVEICAALNLRKALLRELEFA